MTAFTPVMVTHASRERERAVTLPQLASAGVEPMLLVSENEDAGSVDAEVRRLGGVACRLAHECGTGLLFLEDDIDVNARLLPTHVRIAGELQVPVTFCLLRGDLLPGGIRRVLTERRPLPVCVSPLVSVDADRGFHGSMAVFLPRAMVAYAALAWREFETENGECLRHPVIEPDYARGKVTGFDFWVKHHAHRFGGLHVALPNSVDHRSPASVKSTLSGTVARASARSETFGWPTRG